MKIEPKSGPSITAPTGTSTSTQQAAREKAIAMLSTPSAQSPVLNQNSIAPEEMSAATGHSHLNNTAETVSPTATPPEEPKVAEDPISTQYATLARKEKALRAKAIQQEQALKAKEAAILAKEEALKAKEVEYQSKYISKDKLTQDTLNALAEAGLTYDQITELMLTQNSPERQAQSAYEKRLDAKLQELENKQTQAAKSIEQQQTAAYQQALAQIRAETKQLVTIDPNFETIKETNSVSDVVELIERTFKQDGILLSVEDAARQVEDYLVEEAFKLTKLKKIQQRLTPAKPAEAPKQESPKQPQTLKTLSNAVASPGKLSSRERAIAAFKGQMK
jgi:hypothetical protein